jgi:hypothetical protein
MLKAIADRGTPEMRTYVGRIETCRTSQTASETDALILHASKCLAAAGQDRHREG